MSLMPCFGPDQAAAEGSVIGNLLAGYGELEVEMCACLIKVEGQIDLPVREIFSKRGAEERINRARKLLKADYANAGLQTGLVEALDDMDYCREIRNQYAHCQWYWTIDEGLCFVNLEELARQTSPIVYVTHNKRPISLPLLQAQENFFYYVKGRLMNLRDSYQEWDQKRAGRRPSIHVFAKPTKIERPLLHN
jgi:hypothetical protein